MVGFAYRAEAGQLTRHYYVVPDAANAGQAREAALRRANAPGERARRDGQPVQPGDAEVRPMITGPLGDLNLSTPHMVPSIVR
ncbi:hypothetical protein ABZ770_32210 [Streptomyces sp. NPDC006654]|uniref:hypothetical protein n=1 Tax=Streptomyces sp. NPDC006654 TaxID=3156897 RepID=UPI0033EBA7AD